MSGIIGPLFDLAALSIVANTTKEILGNKKKKKAEPVHEEKYESFW